MHSGTIELELKVNSIVRSYINLKKEKAMSRKNLMKSYCDCDICTGKKSIFKVESDLHLFVGANNFNHQCDLSEFEHKVEFDSVTLWDIGFCDDARFFIYNDECGNSIAWYDRARSCGFV